MILMSFLTFIEITFVSSILFLFMKYKIKIHTRHLYKDNLCLILTLSIINLVSLQVFGIHLINILLIINPLLVILAITLIGFWRFYRDPNRQITTKKNAVVSPADGQVIYIKELNRGETPFSVKNKKISKLQEITKTSILNEPCYLIGIVMTIFDVHVNRSPISGKVVLQEHFNGKFLSLKSGKSDVENERNTLVIKNKKELVGTVQIASKRVRRIDSYVKEGEEIEKGQRIGMIKFGSQVDLIIPRSYNVVPEIGDQVFAGKTIIAER